MPEKEIREGVQIPVADTATASARFLPESPMLIVCEGHSEQIYLTSVIQRLGLMLLDQTNIPSGIRIITLDIATEPDDAREVYAPDAQVIQPEQNQPIYLFNHALAIVADGAQAFSEAWIVCDTDNTANAPPDKLRLLLGKLPTQVSTHVGTPFHRALSCHAFEAWLYLHTSNITAQTTNIDILAGLETELREHCASQEQLIHKAIKRQINMRNITSNWVLTMGRLGVAVSNGIEQNLQGDWFYRQRGSELYHLIIRLARRCRKQAITDSLGLNRQLLYCEQQNV